MVFVSGQIPFTPLGEPVQGTFVEKSDQVIRNVISVLEESGSSLEKIAKVTVFLTDMSKFLEFNTAYSKYFNTHKPARSCVAVKELPLGCEVEMEAIAIE